VSRGRTWIALALGGAVFTGTLVDDALARRRKARLVASVDGKRFKGWKRAIQGTYSTVSFSAGGSTRPKRGISRTLVVDCAGVNVAAVPLPVTPTPDRCTGIYTELNIRTGDFKAWSSPGMAVTVSAFDGSRLVGTFSGVIQPADPADAPLAVENGTFNLPVLDVGV
jgi:hypothetical protein